MNKGIFPALDDFNTFFIDLLVKSGSDIEYLISYWNQLVSNLPFDEFVTINLYNQCYDDDILGRSIEVRVLTTNSFYTIASFHTKYYKTLYTAVESRLRELVRYARLASWPFYPLLGIVQVSVIEGLEVATGYNCAQLINIS